MIKRSGRDQAENIRRNQGGRERKDRRNGDDVGNREMDATVILRSGTEIGLFDLD